MAYIDELEREGGRGQKVYYSVLVKGVDNLDQVNNPYILQSNLYFVTLPLLPTVIYLL